MNLKYFLILPLILSANILYADSDIYNQIENDHRIRNFAFIGPFLKSFNADSLIKTIDSENFSIDNTVNYKGENH